MTATEYTVTTPATRLVQERDDEVRTILAHRIDAMAKAIDAEREILTHNSKVGGLEAAMSALSIQGSTVALQELERVWECLFEDIPSLLTIGQIVQAS